MTKPRHVRPGDPIRASDFNGLTGLLGAAGGWGSGVSLASGPGGIKLSADEFAALRLFEATANFAVDPLTPSELPSGNAVEVWRYPATDSYAANSAHDVTLFDHLAGAPLRTGQQAWGQFNRQSGRWEVVCRVEPGLFPCVVATNTRPIISALPPASPASLQVYPASLSGDGTTWLWNTSNPTLTAYSSFVSGVLFAGDLIWAAGTEQRLEIVTHGGTFWTDAIVVGSFVSGGGLDYSGYTCDLTVRGVTYRISVDKGSLPAGFPAGTPLVVGWYWHKLRFFALDRGCPPLPT